MKRTDLQDLLATVERMRRKMHPDLDGDFLRAVVQAEDTFPEDDASALNLIEEALSKSLERSNA